MSYVEVSLVGYPEKWTSGAEVISVQVGLGQQDKSSSCTIVLADDRSAIANRLINHTLAAGGIQTLPDAPKDATADTIVTPQGQPSSPTGWEVAIVQECIRQGVTLRTQVAYILATVQRESSMGVNLEELESGVAYEGRRDLGNTQPGDGVRFKGRGLVQITGRSNYTYWSKRLGVDFVKNPALAKEAKYALPILVIGMKEGRYTGAKLGDYISGNKTDFYNARRIVNSLDHAQEIADDAVKRLPQVDSLLNANGKPVATLPAKESTSPLLETPTGIVKGNKLLVSISGVTFEYYHQGTSTNGTTTTLTGQGVRYVLNRRKRNKTEQNLKLSELATKIAKAQGVKLDFKAEMDLTYTFIDQTGISDYELLKRECDKLGLFCSEVNGTLTIKSLRDIRDTALVMEPTVNLLSYQIDDKAVDSSTEAVGSSLLQDESKVRINPITGQFEQLVPDIDPVKDQSLTGNSKPLAGGTLQPGMEAVADQNRARVKRVKGLPSTFTVILDNLTLDIKPLDAVRTKGLPGVLSRVWLVDKVDHRIPEGTTTLMCYSPVEVLDATPATTDTPAPTTATASNPSGFIWGCKGVITSLFGPRKGKMHYGTDIGAPQGTPVVAAATGQVIAVGLWGGGGQTVQIKHTNGWKTLYMHLSAYKTTVGKTVQQGELIGLVGNTGRSFGAHLHFEIRDAGGVARPPGESGLKAVVKGDVV